MTYFSAKNSSNVKEEHFQAKLWKKNSKPWCTATLHPWPSQYTRGFSAQPLSSAQTQHPPTISRIFFRGILWFNELWWIFCWLKDELALLTQPPFIIFFLDLWQPFFLVFWDHFLEFRESTFTVTNQPYCSRTWSWGCLWSPFWDVGAALRPQ